MKSILAPLVFAASAYAQLITTTYTWAQGDTAVVSLYTTAGVLTYSEVRVLQGTGTGLTATTLPTSASSSSSRAPLVNTLDDGLTTTSTSRTSTSTRTRATTTQTGPDTTTQQRVGQDTALPPPMRTTTYWYDVGDGSPWSVATWTATYTGAPTVGTALVPQGTVQTFAGYQTSVNARVLASAQAQQSGSDAGKLGVGMGGVVGMAVAGAGAVLGAALVL